MEKKRFIFDLDETLLTADMNVQRDYLESIYGEAVRLFHKEVGPILDRYELGFEKYDTEMLSRYLRARSGLPFTKEVIEGWVDVMSDVSNTIEDGVIDLLEYLKNKDKSLVVLTNWFSSTQIQRLKNTNLWKYFDTLYGGKYHLKPHFDSYEAAIGPYQKEKCVIIGDNLEKDYLSPRRFGIDSILYDKRNVQEKGIVKVKKMSDIIKRY